MGELIYLATEPLRQYSWLNTYCSMLLRSLHEFINFVFKLVQLPGFVS
ncbi:hypothetical protein BTN50_0706 [Candidatus Enterovibrio altilux]|uniref:Uncharacterized protein n=1 Tax=Candidatus Enterovibrio altilux TaxID=1927128 RepID=A0A291B8A3_9GAMM|nr:hypothetical protein BTN50_0706 [Candidatus Enterovibrio luxaltus]